MQTIPVRVTAKGVYDATAVLTPEIVQGRIRKEMDELEARLKHEDSTLSSRLSTLRNKQFSDHAQVVNRLNGLDSSLSSTNRRIDTVSQKIANAESKLSTLPGTHYD